MYAGSLDSALQRVSVARTAGARWRPRTLVCTYTRESAVEPVMQTRALHAHAEQR